MNLQQLLSFIPYYRSEPSIDFSHIEIQSIQVDSREVTKDDIFVCIRGYTVDGHDYAHAAVEQGASAIISEQEIDVDIPVIIVPDTSRALPLIANMFYDSPSKDLHVIGLTGTNGKTTVTYILEALFQAYEKKTGVIGTIQRKIGNTSYPIENTTPHALELQKNFSQMVAEDVDVCMMEVSSHALDLGRVHGCDFNLAIFTNLSQDHLDYHKNMEAYFQAKSLLFSQLGNTYNIDEQKHAIINVDDAYAEKLKRVTAQHILTYGIENEADVYATNIHFSNGQTSYTLHTPIGSVDICTPLIGSFNVYNMLAAASAAIIYEIPLTTIATTFANIKGVDGRFEQVVEGQPFSVIVDYAHTPDSLQNVLNTVKEFATNDVYVVVGCGGDRDTSKRPLMAKIAVEHADEAIFTSDNPRTEDPQLILNDMTDGLQQTNYETIIDRKEAIYFAVEKAKQDDIIIIAGKGHETDQMIGKQKFEFDDRKVAAEAIRSLDRKMG